MRRNRAARRRGCATTWCRATGWRGPEAAMAADTATLRAGFDAVRARIDAACRAAGRDPGEVRLLPVSKTVAEARLRPAYALGVRELRENKVQEAMAKSEAMAHLQDRRAGRIGHLQANKAKYAARFASEFQARDSLRVAQALDARLQKLGRAIDVLVQVNTSGESSKFGLPPEEVPAAVKQLPAFSSLRVRG